MGEQWQEGNFWSAGGDKLKRRTNSLSIRLCDSLGVGKHGWKNSTETLLFVKTV